MSRVEAETSQAVPARTGIRVSSARSRLVALLTASFLAGAWTTGGTTRADATGDPVLVGAGDIAACRGAGDSATATLVRAIPGTVFTTGDNAYQSGTAAEYADCYGPT